MNYSELLQLAKGWGNFVSDRINIGRLRITQYYTTYFLIILSNEKKFMKKTLPKKCFFHSACILFSTHSYCQNCTK